MSNLKQFALLLLVIFSAIITSACGEPETALVKKKTLKQETQKIGIREVTVRAEDEDGNVEFHRDRTYYRTELRVTPKHCLLKVHRERKLLPDNYNMTLKPKICEKIEVNKEVTIERADRMSAEHRVDYSGRVTDDLNEARRELKELSKRHKSASVQNGNWTNGPVCKRTIGRSFDVDRECF